VGGGGGVGGGGERERGDEGVEIEEGARREVTKSFLPPFRFSPVRAAARAISLLVPARAAKDSLLHHLGVRYGWLAENNRFRCSYRVRPNDALRTVLCNNAGSQSIQQTVFCATIPANQTRPRNVVLALLVAFSNRWRHIPNTPTVSHGRARVSRDSVCTAGFITTLYGSSHVISGKTWSTSLCLDL
jgi:hypothetical protein